MQINHIKAQAADDMARDYIPRKEAGAITGMNSRQLLAFCTEHKVRHHKYGTRWLIATNEAIQDRQDMYGTFYQVTDV